MRNLPGIIKQVLIVSSILLFSCQDADSEVHQQTSTEFERKDSITIKGKQEAESASDVLLKNEVKHLFSDTLAADLFQIFLKGDSLISSTVAFNIISSKGDTLHHETFPAAYLIGYELISDSATLAQKEAVIKRRISKFFDEKNFLTPAIKPDQKFNPEYIEKSVWEDLKSDESAIGFYYLVGEEDGRRIAYSKKQKKVVLYFNCC